MKTKEQVLEHLLEVGYTPKAIGRICGFMVAKDMKGVDELITIKGGDNEFKDFLNYYNGFIGSLTIFSKDDVVYKSNINSIEWSNSNVKKNSVWDIKSRTILNGGLIWDTKVSTVFNGNWILDCNGSIPTTPNFIPKFGEFYYVCNSTYTGGNFIIQRIKSEKEKQCTQLMYFKGLKLYTSDLSCFNDDTSLIRLATKEEIQLFKDEMRNQLNLEWNGSSWVKIKHEYKDGDYAKVVKKGITWSKDGLMDYLLGRIIKISKSCESGTIFMEEDTISNKKYFFVDSDLEPSTKEEFIQQTIEDKISKIFSLFI